MLARLTSILLFGLAMIASTASAQGDITIDRLGIDGREEDELDLILTPVNAAECADSGVEITLRISNIDTTKTVLDFWRTIGADCNQVDQRDDETDRACTPVDLGEVQTTIEGQSQKDLTIPLNALVDCTKDGEQSLFILAAMGEETTEDVGTEWGEIKIAVDTTPPGPVTGVSAGSGNTEVNVSWDAMAMRTEYLLFVDTAGTCEEPTLMAGEEVPDDADDVRNTQATTVSVNPGEVGLAVGQSAPVFVAAKDPARNLGVLSESACLTRVETSGFCEQFGECEEGCSVSRAGGRALPSASAAWVAVAAALLFLRRRKSIARSK